MSDFHDPDLRQQLGRLSGPYPDDNVAFEQWQRRVGQARRRRAVAWTTGAALSLIIGTVVVTALQRPTEHSLVPSNSTESTEEFIATVPTTDVDESSTIELTVPVPVPVPEPSAPTTLAPDTTPSSEVEPESSLPETEGTAAAGQPSGGVSTTNHEATSTSVEAPELQTITQKFASDGGSITVRQEGERLKVVATSPRAGFHTDQNDVSGRRVQVTFKSAGHHYQMTVRLLDGVMRASTSTTTSDEPHEDSAPGDTTGGEHDGGDDD